MPSYSEITMGRRTVRGSDDQVPFVRAKGQGLRLRLKATEIEFVFRRLVSGFSSTNSVDDESG